MDVIVVNIIFAFCSPTPHSVKIPRPCQAAFPSPPCPSRNFCRILTLSTRMGCPMAKRVLTKQLDLIPAKASLGAARGGQNLQELRPVEARHANRFWRRRRAQQTHARRRATGRSGRPGRQTIRRPRRQIARQRSRGSRNRPQKSLRHQCRQTFQVGAARKTPHPQKTQRRGNRRLPPVARCRNRRDPARK